MARRMTAMDLQVAAQNGAEVNRPKQVIDSPQLGDIAEIMRQFAAMKQEMSDKYEAKWRAKLAKMDELINAIANIKLEGGEHSAEVVRLLAQIKKEHSTMGATQAALKEVAHVHENCAYKVTGRRDQRGLIDLEYGLTFTPVSE